MMIIRLIILIALVSLLIFAYRKLTGASQADKPSDADLPNTMKKCEHCGVHLPQAEACRHNDHYFCSEEHRQAYLEQHPDD